MANFKASDVRATIVIPDTYGEDQRISIGNDMIKQIRKRCAAGIDLNGRSFKYVKDSKHKGDNLTDTGDMLTMLEVISTSKGAITIGYVDIESIEAAQAAGNTLGSYGKTPDPKKAKPFINVTDEEKELILAQNRQEISAEEAAVKDISESFFAKTETTVTPKTTTSYQTTDIETSFISNLFKTQGIE